MYVPAIKVHQYIFISVYYSNSVPIRDIFIYYLPMNIINSVKFSRCFFFQTQLLAMGSYYVRNK